MKKIILLIPLLCLLTGCYNYRELNDLAIISGVSVSKDKNTYKITTEVVNPKKEQDTSSGKEPDYVIYEGSGSSMQEAFRNILFFFGINYFGCYFIGIFNFANSNTTNDG